VQAPNAEILLQRAVNASMGGVMLELDFNPAPNAQLLMKLEAMYHGFLLNHVVKGRVCHVVVKQHTYLVGVEFLNPPDALRRFLQRYVNKEI
jgi:hypothetical protein